MGDRSPLHRLADRLRRTDPGKVLVGACLLAMTSPVMLFLFEEGLRLIYGAGAFQGWEGDAFERPAHIVRGMVGTGWLILVIRTLFFQRRGTKADRAANRIFLIIPSVATLMLSIAALPLVRVLNGMLDGRSRLVVRAELEHRWTEISHSPRGRTIREHRASVRTTAPPIEEHILDWDGCPSSAESWSDFVTLRLGRGAFGIPWVSGVECHPRSLADEPLAGDVFLGGGAPVLLLTLTGQSRPGSNPALDELEALAQRLREVKEAVSAPLFGNVPAKLPDSLAKGPASVPAETRERWRQRLRTARLGETPAEARREIVEEVALEAAMLADEQIGPDAQRASSRQLAAAAQWLAAWRQRPTSSPAIVARARDGPLQEVPCAGCMAVTADDLHKSPLSLAAPGEKPFARGSRALLFDGKGTLRMAVDLEDTAAIPRVLATIDR